MMRRMAGKQQTRAAHAAGYATVAEWQAAGSPPPLPEPVPGVVLAELARGKASLDHESRDGGGMRPTPAAVLARPVARVPAHGGRPSFAQTIGAVLAEKHPEWDPLTRQEVISLRMVERAETDPRTFELIADRVDGRAVQTVQTAGATSPEAMAELTTDAIFARLDALRNSVASRALSDGAVDGECSE